MMRRTYPLLLALPLLLSACGRPGDATLVTRRTVDGADTVHVVTEVARGIARFHCESARSGTCRIVAYARTCEREVSVRGRRIDEHCTTRTLARLDVAAGVTRAVRGLPAIFGQCADDRAAPDPAACAK
jgi:hypothetical protein